MQNQYNRYPTQGITPAEAEIANDRFEYYNNQYNTQQYYQQYPQQQYGYYQQYPQQQYGYYQQQYPQQYGYNQQQYPQQYGYNNNGYYNNYYNTQNIKYNDLDAPYEGTYEEQMAEYNRRVEIYNKLLAERNAQLQQMQYQQQMMSQQLQYNNAMMNQYQPSYYQQQYNQPTQYIQPQQMEQYRVREYTQDGKEVDPDTGLVMDTHYVEKNPNFVNPFKTKDFQDAVRARLAQTTYYKQNNIDASKVNLDHLAPDHNMIRVQTVADDQVMKTDQNPYNINIPYVAQPELVNHIQQMYNVNHSNDPNAFRKVDPTGTYKYDMKEDPNRFGSYKGYEYGRENPFGFRYADGVGYTIPSFNNNHYDKSYGQQYNYGMYQQYDPAVLQYNYAGIPMFNQPAQYIQPPSYPTFNNMQTDFVFNADKPKEPSPEVKADKDRIAMNYFEHEDRIINHKPIPGYDIDKESQRFREFLEKKKAEGYVPGSYATEATAKHFARNTTGQEMSCYQVGYDPIRRPCMLLPQFSTHFYMALPPYKDPTIANKFYYNQFEPDPKMTVIPDYMVNSYHGMRRPTLTMQGGIANYIDVERQQEAQKRYIELLKFTSRVMNERHMTPEELEEHVNRYDPIYIKKKMDEAQAEYNRTAHTVREKSEEELDFERNFEKYRAMFYYTPPAVSPYEIFINNASAMYYRMTGIDPHGSLQDYFAQANDYMNRQRAREEANHNRAKYNEYIQLTQSSNLTKQEENTLAALKAESNRLASDLENTTSTMYELAKQQQERSSELSQEDNKNIIDTIEYYNKLAKMITVKMMETQSSIQSIEVKKVISIGDAIRNDPELQKYDDLLHDPNRNLVGLARFKDDPNVNPYAGMTEEEIKELKGPTVEDLRKEKYVVGLARFKEVKAINPYNTSEEFYIDTTMNIERTEESSIDKFFDEYSEAQKAAEKERRLYSKQNGLEPQQATYDEIQQRMRQLDVNKTREDLNKLQDNVDSLIKHQALLREMANDPNKNSKNIDKTIKETVNISTKNFNKVSKSELKKLKRMSGVNPNDKHILDEIAGADKDECYKRGHVTKRDAWYADKAARGLILPYVDFVGSKTGEYYKKNPNAKYTIVKRTKGFKPLTEEEINKRIGDY